MAKKQIDVIKAFFNGEKQGKASNLYIEGKNLMNYNTILAQRVDIGEGKIRYLINLTRYSVSTTTIQNQIVSLVPEQSVLSYKHDIPEGADYLV